VLVRVLAGLARPVGPQNADAQLAELVELADASGHDAHAAALSLAFERGFVRTVGRLERVEDEADGQRIDHVGGSAHVVPVRVGHDERCEAADSERTKLTGNTRLGRALVDQHRARPRLQQDPVSLPDIEHHDPEALRRRRRMIGTQAPAEDDDRGDYHQNRRAAASWGRQSREHEPKESERRERRQRLPRGELGLGK
jgi:hypothetical protein